MQHNRVQIQQLQSCMSILTPIKGRYITHIKLNIINQVGSSLIQGNDILGNHIIDKKGGGEREREREMNILQSNNP